MSKKQPAQSGQIWFNDRGPVAAWLGDPTRRSCSLNRTIDRAGIGDTAIALVLGGDELYVVYIHDGIIKHSFRESFERYLRRIDG